MHSHVDLLFKQLSHMKWYVVFRGRKPGVYNDWGTCQAQVDGYKGASFRGCRDRKEAEEAFLAYGATTGDMPKPNRATTDQCPSCTFKNALLAVQMVSIAVMAYVLYK
jgi:ribonuclease HI